MVKWSRVSSATLAMMIVAYGCGSERPPAAGDSVSNLFFAPGSPCTVNGALAECHAVISKHDNIVNCMQGTQVCEDGAWGPCQSDPSAGGVTVTTRVVGAGGLDMQALGTAGSSGLPCSQDPCNPYCSGWNETPPTAVAPAACGSGVSGAIIPTANQIDNQNDCTQSDGNQGCWWANECCAKKSGNSWTCDDQASSSCKRCTSGKADYSTSVACVVGTQVHEWVCNQGSNAPGTGSLVARFWDGGTHGKADMHQGCSHGGDWAPYYGKCTVDLSKITLKTGDCVDIFTLPQTGVTCVDASNNQWLPGTALLGKKFVTWVNGGNSEACTVATGALDECSWWNNVGGVPVPPSCTTNADCPTNYTCSSSVCIGPTCTTNADCMGGAICTGTPKKCKLVQPICDSSATSTTYTQTYQMICPPGTKGSWDLLGFNASVPTGASMSFAVQTSGAATGPWVPAAGTPAGALVATAPTDHPAPCALTGPAPCGGAYPGSCTCPIDIYTPLKTASSGAETNPYLTLNVSLTSACGAQSTFIPTSANGTNASCAGGKDDAIGTCTTNADCNQDFRCQAGTCIWNKPDSDWYDPTCVTAAGSPGVDLTVGVPCELTYNSGTYSIPICNRGGGTVAAGTVIKLMNDGNGGHGVWDCSTTNPPSSTGASKTCTYTLPKALGPGDCQSIDTSTPAGSACSVLETGERDIYINWDRSITECGTGFTGSGPGCMNNSTHTKATGGSAANACPPTCATPPPVGVPQLASWQVTYSCVPAE